MKRFQRWPIFKVLYSPLSVVIVGLVVVLLARSVWGVYKKEAVAGETARAALYELQVMQERRDGLAKDVSGLEDPEGIEAALREKYSMAKEGERVIVIGEEDPVERKTPSADEKSGFWDFFKNLFDGE